MLLPEFVSYSGDLNMSVTLEFSQAVFRLGHSRAERDDADRGPGRQAAYHPGDAGYNPTFSEVGLFDAFLNPALYDATGASAIALGLINQQANADRRIRHLGPAAVARRRAARPCPR